MHYQHLSNFIKTRIRKNDTFIPGMILFLVKNNGKGTKEQISRLLYIFDFKHELSHYDTIVEKFAATLLKEYNIIYEENDIYHLITWPLNDSQIFEITKECMMISNGLFSHIPFNETHIKEAS